MDNAIQVRGLTKRFGSVEALRGVNLSVPRGSVTALLGLNGAGKTTLLRTLIGLVTPDSGEGQVLGYPLGAGYPSVELKARIGWVGERPVLYDRLTATELLRFVRGIHRRWEQSTVDRYLRLFGLPMHRPVGQFSTGMKSQLALTLAMGGSPDLLILDEPTVGLDPYHRHQYLQVLLDDAVTAGRTVFLSTHDLAQIERIADRVVILRAGEVLLAEPLDELKEETRRFRAAFASSAAARSAMIDLPGLVDSRQEGRSVVLTVRGDHSAIRRMLEQQPGLEGLQSYDLSLEEIFLAHVAPREA